MRSDQLANQVNIIATQLASLKGKIPAHGHQHTDFIGLSPDLIFKEQKIDTLGFFKKSFATKWDYTLIGWLQMEYEPEGLDADQMQRFENQIDAWIAKYEGTLPTASDF